VIAGHGRFLGGRKLGWSEVLTICLDHLSDAQAKAYMIADIGSLLAQTLAQLKPLEISCAAPLNLWMARFGTGVIEGILSKL
jgi:hypothetical protein